MLREGSSPPASFVPFLRVNRSCWTNKGPPMPLPLPAFLIVPFDSPPPVGHPG